MSHSHLVRIIGGQWRGRKLCFPDLPELRPTPNRVRETLFNWLAPHIVGAHCLDLFSGSGALGFEALSRGAASVLMVDQSAVVIKKLRENAALLGAEKTTQFYCGKAPDDKIPVQDRRFDIVFLDPPFHQNYLPRCCEWLERTHCLAPNTLIYIEVESSLPLPLPIPAHWALLHNQKAGQVRYCLVQKEENSSSKN